jgi:phenylalanine ammonia-lyase
MDQVKGEIDTITAALCDSACSLTQADTQNIQNATWKEIMLHWNRSSTSDLHDRSQRAAQNSLGAVVQLLPAPKTTTSAAARLIAQHDWIDRVANALETRYSAVRAQFQANPTTKGYLCGSSRKMYELVREKLGVPLHRGIIDYPTYASAGHDSKEKQCTGSQVSKIFAALRGDAFREELPKCWSFVDSVINGYKCVEHP